MTEKKTGLNIPFNGYTYKPSDKFMDLEDGLRGAAKRVAEEKERKMYEELKRLDEIEASDYTQSHVQHNITLDVSSMGLDTKFTERELRKAMDQFVLNNPISTIDAISAMDKRNHLEREQPPLRAYHKEQLIYEAAKQLNRVPTDMLVQSTLDFIERNGKDTLPRVQQMPGGIRYMDDSFIEPMVQALCNIHGVMKAEPMFNDYPASVSVIVKVNMSHFDDEEVDKYMELIDSTIQSYKPDELIELEIIYHNKVVY